MNNVDFKQDFTSIFAVIDIDNVDTDMLIPKQFLKTTKRIGLGEYLFYEKRYDKDGKKNSSFVLNQPPFDKAQIIVAGQNFGCGSSREHAPWALKDFGIQVIIAKSYADIFYNNCFENLILPIKLKEDEVDYIMKNKDKCDKITINVEKQTVSFDDKVFNFDIKSGNKYKIINQIDSITETLSKMDLIDEFEKKNNI